MYSILEAGGKNTKKAKGVKKNVVKKHIGNEQTFRHGMEVLRSERHRIYGQLLNKVSLTLRLKALDRKKWGGHAGIWTQGCGPCRMSSRRGDGCLHCRVDQRQINQIKLCVGWHNKQLFSNKASLWGIVALQVVQHGLRGFGHQASQPVHFKRPHGVSGPPATTLQFTGLVTVANADPRGDFLLFEAKRASRDYRGGLLCQRLGLDGRYTDGLFVS